MSIDGLIGTVILALGSLLIVGFPFLRRGRNPQSSDMELVAQKARDELLTTYERVLATIRDLDEDRQTGKLNPIAYQSERAYWVDIGVKVLRELEPDATDDSIEILDQPSPNAPEQVLDEAIEQAIKAYRKAQSEA